MIGNVEVAVDGMDAVDVSDSVQVGALVNDSVLVEVRASDREAESAWVRVSDGEVVWGRERVSVGTIEPVLDMVEVL